MLVMKMSNLSLVINEMSLILGIITVYYLLLYFFMFVSLVHCFYTCLTVVYDYHKSINIMILNSAFMQLRILLFILHYFRMM
jgi:hypothetical protein